MKLISPVDHAASVREVHPSQRQDHVQPVSEPLHVVTMISNPMRFASRYRLYRAFEKMCADAGAILWTVEVALRDRHHEITRHDNPHHLQLRSPSILWVKENAQNVLIRHMSAVAPDWAYVLFLDADTQFARPDWAVELVHLLQTFQVVQPWSHNISLGPVHQPIADSTSFLYNWQQNEAILQPWDRKDNKPQPRSGFKPKHHDTGDQHCHCDGDGSKGQPPHPPHPHEPPIAGGLHTGYGLAFRRGALSDIGGLGEIGILGSGDRHMLYALVGEVERSFPTGISQQYKDYWRRWQARTERFIGRNVGAMDGLLLDGWHGSKVYRRYVDRWTVLTKCRFDPDTDLTHDVQGLLTWSGANPELERQTRAYFAQRSEDSIDL